MSCYKAMKKIKMIFLVNGDVESEFGTRARNFAQKIDNSPETFIVYQKETETKFQAMLHFGKALFQLKPQLVYLLHPGYSNSSVGLIAKFFGVKLISDIGDMAYETARTVRDRTLLHLFFLKNMEKLLWKVSDVLLATGSYFKEWLNARGYKNTYFIPSGVDMEEIKPVELDEKFRESFNLNGYLTVGILGRSIWNTSINWCYGMEIVETIKLLNDQRFKGVIIGYGNGISVLKKMVKEYGLTDKIVFVGRIPYKEIPKYLNLIDICVSTQINNIVGRMRTTEKLPIYLACNKFIIATKVGEARRALPEEMLISYYGTKDLTYPERLAKKIMEIQKNPEILKKKDLGRAIVKKYFEYEELGKEVAVIVKSLICH